MSVACATPICDTLVLCARLIADAVDHVLNQLIETMSVTNRDFVAWRHKHATELVAPNARRRGKTTAPAAHRILVKRYGQPSVTL